MNITHKDYVLLDGIYDFCSVTVTPNGQDIHEFVMVPAKTLEGRITDAGGKPVTYNIVFACSGKSTTHNLHGGFLEVRTRTDGNGYFAMGVIPETYYLKLTGRKLIHLGEFKVLNDTELNIQLNVDQTANLSRIN